jgi:hypothetical protein
MAAKKAKKKAKKTTKKKTANKRQPKRLSAAGRKFLIAVISNQATRDVPQPFQGAGGGHGHAEHQNWVMNTFLSNPRKALKEVSAGRFRFTAGDVDLLMDVFGRLKAQVVRDSYNQIEGQFHGHGHADAAGGGPSYHGY